MIGFSESDNKKFGKFRTIVYMDYNEDFIKYAKSKNAKWNSLEKCWSFYDLSVEQKIELEQVIFEIYGVDYRD